MTSNTTLSSTTDDESTTTETATSALITTDASAGGHQTNHDLDGERRLSTSVVQAVATALGTDPLSLDERLYDVLDPDALDRLFDGGGEATGPRTLSFDLAGCSVTVHGDGRIVVRRAP
jgi:hypothetical protein